MVAIAQSVERLVVVQEVASSSLVSHPIGPTSFDVGLLFSRGGVVLSSEVVEIDPVEAARAVRAGTPLVDVRGDDEWQAWHVEGAVHIPLDELGVRSDEVPREGVVLVVCAHGVRSRKAAAHLRDLGIDAVSVSGGLAAWPED